MSTTHHQGTNRGYREHHHSSTGRHHKFQCQFKMAPEHFTSVHQLLTGLIPRTNWRARQRPEMDTPTTSATGHSMSLVASHRTRRRRPARLRRAHGLLLRDAVDVAAPQHDLPRALHHHHLRANRKITGLVASSELKFERNCSAPPTHQHATRKRSCDAQ